MKLSKPLCSPLPETRLTRPHEASLLFASYFIKILLSQWVPAGRAIANGACAVDY